MIPREAIEKAIEGGWHGTKHITLETDIGIVLTDDAKGETHVPLFTEIVLDPTFWQALGKSLGWYQSIYKDGKFSKEHSIYPNPLEAAHDFYDLILTGQSTEGFWAGITVPSHSE